MGLIFNVIVIRPSGSARSASARMQNAQVGEEDDEEARAAPPSITHQNGVFYDRPASPRPQRRGENMQIRNDSEVGRGRRRLSSDCWI